MKKIFLLLTLSALFASCSQETIPPVSSGTDSDTHIKTNPRQKRNQHIHYTHQK